MVLQAAEALPTDGAELSLSGVGRLVAAQVGGLREALPAGGAAVRPHLLVHQLVARQVAGVVEALPAHVADERLVEVGHPVGLEHADAGVTLPTDVAVAALLAGVPRLHVQVAVRLVVEPLGAVVAGVRQQPVLFDLVFAELHDAGERCATHRAGRVRLLLVFGEPLGVGKQHVALRAPQVSLRSRCDGFLLPAAAAISSGSTLGGGSRWWRRRPSILVVISLTGRGGGQRPHLTCGVSGAGSVLT